MNYQIMLKTLKIIGLVVVSILLTIIILPFAFVGYAYLCTPTPAKPEITYGEFPFEIVYEIDGDVKTINDVYVCEYDGISFGSNGKNIKWKGYIKSTGEEKLILLEDGNLKLACAIGFPEYYMGNYMDNYGVKEEYVPHISYIKPNPLGGTSSGGMNEQMLEKYKIELISWKLSKPIQNTFK